MEFKLNSIYFWFRSATPGLGACGSEPKVDGVQAELDLSSAVVVVLVVVGHSVSAIKTLARNWFAAATLPSGRVSEIAANTAQSECAHRLHNAYAQEHD